MIKPFREYIWFDNDIFTCDQVDERLLSKGYTVYEVMRVINGRLIFLHDHLHRFRASARNSGFDLWLSEEEITSKLYAMIQANGAPDGNIELSANYQPEACPNIKHIMAWYIPHSYPEALQYEQGVNTIFYFSERISPNTKYRNVPLKEAAKAMMESQGAYEVILVNQQGYVTEGSRSNIFFVKETELYTAPQDMVLMGVTRHKVIHLARMNGIVVRQEKIHYETLGQFQAAFITGTSPKVLPVRKIEEYTFDVHNSLMRSIMQWYDELLAREIAAECRIE
ncbi:MAG: aminotransferase class IV [Bacteroidales bacterium]